MKQLKRMASALLAAALMLPMTPAPVSAATETQPAPAAGCMWYKVKYGDTLLKLADRFNTTAQKIMAANKMKTTRIYAGTSLCIPQPPPPPNPNPSGPWHAEFWNNPDQSGAPALARMQAQVMENWGYWSPSPQVQTDNFSARFTRQIMFSPGVYRFTIHADDGVRLRVGNNVALDQYGYIGDHTWVVDVPVNAGWQPVRLDYVERGGLALAQLSYYRVSLFPHQPPGPPPPPPGPGGWGGPWSAAFFNNHDLAGAAVWTSSYPRIDFNWGYGSPSPAVPADHFSARFSCNCYIGAGTYRFVAKSDDGVRVYVDGARVIDQWREQSANYFTSADIPLGAGYHNITIEYMEMGANALIQFYWLNLPSGTKAGP